MTSGEVTWEVKQKSGGQSNDFLSLVDGKNKVRFITNPFAYVVHDYKHPAAKWSSKVRCSKGSADGSCPLCDAGLKRKERFYAAVLDRVSNSVKILDFSSAIQNDVAAARDDSDWGPVINYDFTITKNSNAKSPGDWYKSLPSPKKPLTSEEQKMIDEFSKDTLVRLSADWTLEKVKAKINKINEMNGGDPSIFEEKSAKTSSFEKATSSKPTVTKQEVEKEEVTHSSSSDDSDEFEEYDK